LTLSWKCCRCCRQYMINASAILSAIFRRMQPAARDAWSLVCLVLARSLAEWQTPRSRRRLIWLINSPVQRETTAWHYTSPSVNYLTPAFTRRLCSLASKETHLFLPRCVECRGGLAMRILSVRLSVTRVYCDKTKEISVQIFIPYERSFSLVFWAKEWLVGGDPFYLKFWVSRPPLERNCQFWTDIRS